MTDHDDGCRRLVQIVGEPGAGVQVEVVGGLIEEQDVGLGEQQTGQGDAHLPATAEGVAAAVPVVFVEAQAVQHGANGLVFAVATCLSPGLGGSFERVCGVFSGGNPRFCTV